MLKSTQGGRVEGIEWCGTMARQLHAYEACTCVSDDGWGYIEHLFKVSLVGADLGLGHWLHSLTHPLYVHKLHSGNLINQVSLERERDKDEVISNLSRLTYHPEEDVYYLVLLEQLLELIHTSIAYAQDHNWVLYVAILVAKNTPTSTPGMGWKKAARKIRCTYLSPTIITAGLQQQTDVFLVSPATNITKDHYLPHCLVHMQCKPQHLTSLFQLCQTEHPLLFLPHFHQTSTLQYNNMEAIYRKPINVLYNDHCSTTPR